MKLLPPPGPDRRRLLLMIIVVVLGAGAYAKWGRSDLPPIPQTTGPAPTSNFAVAQSRGTGARAQRAAPTTPQALRLAAEERLSRGGFR